MAKQNNPGERQQTPATPAPDQQQSAPSPAADPQGSAAVPLEEMDIGQLFSYAQEKGIEVNYTSTSTAEEILTAIKAAQNNGGGNPQPDGAKEGDKNPPPPPAPPPAPPPPPPQPSAGKEGAKNPPSIVEGKKRVQNDFLKGGKKITVGKGEIVQADADGIIEVDEKEAARLLTIPGYKKA